MWFKQVIPKYELVALTMHKDNVLVAIETKRWTIYNHMGSSATKYLDNLMCITTKLILQPLQVQCIAIAC